MIDSQFLAQYQARQGLLKDKIILITGAGDGIGKSCALTFASHGATIILVGRSMSKLEAVYDEIEAEGYAQPAIFPLNLESATETDYQALHDAIKSEFGRLDGLLHNAGELGPRSPITHYSLANWNKLLQVNLTAPFLLSKALIPLLDHRHSSSIVFTSSGLSRRGKAYWGAYSVTKAATDNLMQIMADELEGITKIRVNAIDPGATRTRMRASAFPAEDPSQVTAPTELMNRYLFLMGSDSELISGQHFEAQPQP